jgi:hypothetical protein
LCHEMQADPGTSAKTHALPVKNERFRDVKKKNSKECFYARFPDAGSIPVGWFRIVRSFMMV